MNSRQRDAYQDALRRQVSLVSGPPGTGKTRFIATLTQDVLAQSPPGPVLLLSETNFAADNLLTAVQKIKEVQVLRLGAAERTAARAWELKTKAERESKQHGQKFFAYRKELLKDVEVVCSTCVRAASFPKELKENHPMLVVDEASQVTGPVLLASVFRRCAKLVLVGDEQQLGPVCALDTEILQRLKQLLPPGLGPAESAFSWLLQNQMTSVMLTEQHRMHPKLAEFPSNHFYQGQLVNAIATSERSLVKGIDWPAFPVKFVDTSQEDAQEQSVGTSWKNVREAEQGSALCAVGSLLQAAGVEVTVVKIDPYLNEDAGTLSPEDHGEVFVLDDGTEVDLDFGHYERALGLTLCGDHSITSGKLLGQVLQNERQHKYLGQTVRLTKQAVELDVELITRAAECPTCRGKADVCLIELGGAVGDWDAEIHLEALRRLQRAAPMVFCLMVPLVAWGGEQKTKLAQDSVRRLRACGIAVDFFGEG